MLSKTEGFVELFSIESSANVSLDISPVEGISEKSGFMLVFNRNSGGEEESDVFGNEVWEVVFWNCGWDSSEEEFVILEDKEPLKGMVESWTDEGISNVGKSNFVEVNVTFDWAMFWEAHATIGDSDRDGHVDGC